MILNFGIFSAENKLKTLAVPPSLSQSPLLPLCCSHLRRMGKKKKFIDKKKSATFQLLARDSSDPNYDDSPGSDRVFVRVDNNLYFVAGDDHDNAANPDSIFSDAPDDYEVGEANSSSRSAAQTLPENVRKEILELGFPDDGYNYLLHLREIKNIGGGSAFYKNSKTRLDLVPSDVKVCFV